MRALLAGLALLFALAPAAHGESLGVVDFQESATLIGASADGSVTVPLKCDAVSCKSPMVATLKVGPLDLKAGDLIDVRMWQEFSNSNAAKGWWTVPRCCDGLAVQSEHWGLWTMASSGVLRGPVVDPNSGKWVLNGLAENWDNYIHHKVFARSGYQRITADATGQYVYARAYFESSLVYTLPGAAIRIEGGSYARLQVAVFRGV